VLGLSAGGHPIAVSTHVDRRVYPAADATEQEGCRPDFRVALSPGHLDDYDTSKLNGTIPVSRNTPPTFLLQTENDNVDGVSNSVTYYIALKNAGVPAELHLYAAGGRAFGLRRTTFPMTA
jgi:acetyl esterase/lipase